MEEFLSNLRILGDGGNGALRVCSQRVLWRLRNVGPVFVSRGSQRGYIAKDFVVDAEVGDAAETKGALLRSLVA
ncbi:hypothetical protein [Sorangium sp. So ce1000]|uniref:hypothetical protein n=1 Tax=Sorangium sp. So ce1000 TaxID=3133325 RepID=UPI003F603CE7